MESAQDNGEREQNGELSARDAYLSDVRRHVQVYEDCVEAIGVICASLEELSTKIDQMKTSAQQLNAFTSGWLSVWKRSA